jgi:hypothetical protein
MERRRSPHRGPKWTWLILITTALLSGCGVPGTSVRPEVPPPPSATALRDFLDKQILPPEAFPDMILTKDGISTAQQLTSLTGELSAYERSFDRGFMAREFLSPRTDVVINIRLHEYLNHALASHALTRDEPGTMIVASGLVPRDAAVWSADNSQTSVIAEFTSGRVLARVLIEDVSSGASRVRLRQVVNAQYARMHARIQDDQDLSSLTTVSGQYLQRQLYSGEVALIVLGLVMVAVVSSLRDRGSRQRLASRSRAGRSQSPAESSDRDVAWLAARRLRNYRGMALLRLAAFFVLMTATFSLRLWPRLFCFTALLVAGVAAETAWAGRRGRRIDRGAVRVALVGVLGAGAALVIAQQILGGLLFLILFAHGDTGFAHEMTIRLFVGFAGIAFAAMVLVDVPYRLVRRISWRRVAGLLAADSRREVLLLRTFTDDAIRLRVHRDADSSLFEHLSLRRRESFEQVVCWVAWRYGPILAVGEPGRRLPPLGAAREFYPDELWQARVARRMQSSRLVLVIAARSPALWSEMGLLHKIGVVAKTLVLVPPLNERELALRLQVMAAAFGVPTKRLQPRDSSGRYLLAFRITELGEVVRYFADARDDVSYRAAIDSAVGEMPPPPSSDILGFDVLDGVDSAAQLPAGLPFADPQPTELRRAARRRRTKRVAIVAGVAMFVTTSWLVTFGEKTVRIPGRTIDSALYPARIGMGAQGDLAVWDARTKRIALLGADATPLAWTPETTSAPWYLTADTDDVFTVSYEPFEVHRYRRSANRLAASWTSTPVGGAPTAVLAARTGLFVLLTEARQLVEYSAATGAVVRRIAVGRGATSLAADDTTLFVGNAVDRSVTEVSLLGTRPPSTFSVDVAPSGLATSPHQLDIASVLGGEVERVDLTTHRPIGRTSVPYANGLIAVDGDRLMVATYGPDDAVVQLASTGTNGLHTTRLMPSPAQFAFLGRTKDGRTIGLPIGTGTLTYL